MSKQYGKVTSIRVPQNKVKLWNEYISYVDEHLESDICAVTMFLVEGFMKAMKEIPEPTTIRLVKQDITINQNCTNIYGTSLKRPRRLMQENQLSKQELPKCEYCNMPATKRFLYPHKGYIDTCNQHETKIPKPYIGERELTESKSIPLEITPTFPLQKRKSKKSRLKKLWNRVIQLFTKGN